MSDPAEPVEGSPIRYYLNGWRYGIVKHVPARGKRKGDVQIENPCTGLVWVPIKDTKEMDE